MTERRERERWKETFPPAERETEKAKPSTVIDQVAGKPAAALLPTTRGTLFSSISCSLLNCVVCACRFLVQDKTPSEIRHGLKKNETHKMNDVILWLPVSC
jgi:hypothetical protein